MSLRSRYHTRGPAWAVRLNSDPLPMVAAPVQLSALDLPGEQKFALIYLRKTKGCEIAKKVLAHLEEAGIPFPTGRHWQELCAAHYVQFIGTGHVLTVSGDTAARIIVRDLAKKYDIPVHAMERTGGRGTGSGTYTRCACGTWSAGPFTNNRAGESRMWSAENGHLRDVKEGRWKPQSLTDFLNKYEPLKLNFSGGPENGAAGLDGCTPTAAPDSLQGRTT